MLRDAVEVNREPRETSEPKRRRRGIFVESNHQNETSSVRSGIFRPYGAGAFVAGGSTKMSPLPGLKFARGKQLKRLGFSLNAGHPAEAGANENESAGTGDI